MPKTSLPRARRKYGASLVKISKKHLYIFGPLTVLVEWTGLLIGIQFAKDFDPNQAISSLSIAPQPLPIIFGTTITLAGLSYYIFSFALKEHTRNITTVAFISGVLLALTGWITYSGNGGVKDLLHNFSIYLAVGGYCTMIWMLRDHHNSRIRLATLSTLWLLLLVGCLAFYCLFISHKLESIAELTVLFLIQIWTLVIVWFSRKEIIQL